MLCIIHVLVCCIVCSYVVWCVLLLLCLLHCSGWLFVPVVFDMMWLIMLFGVCVVGFSVCIGLCCFLRFVHMWFVVLCSGLVLDDVCFCFVGYIYDQDIYLCTCDYVCTHVLYSNINIGYLSGFYGLRRQTNNKGCPLSLVCPVLRCHCCPVILFL